MLAGKVIAITGTPEGIGAELARQLSGKGVWLALAARNEAKLEQVAAECRALGAEAVAIRCDVSVESDCRNFVESAVRKYDSLDILVNNAGVSGHALFEEVSDFAWYETMMRVNYMGSLYCTRYAVPHLKKRRGQIVITDIRLHGYGPDGRPAGVSGLKDYNAMPVEECARQILAATLGRKRQLVMTLQGKIGLWLQLVAPGVVDRMVLKVVRKRRGEA